MQIDADEDMEHGGDFEDVDSAYVLNHYQCGCRELQVFQSDTYAGEHPRWKLSRNVGFALLGILHVYIPVCLMVQLCNPFVHIIRHNVISVITQFDCHRFTNIGIICFVVLTEMCDSHTCRSGR